MLSAAASLGMILLWDVDGGLTQIDKYLYSSEDYIKVGLGKMMQGKLEPGSSIGYHKHEGNCEMIFIVEGEGKVLFDDGEEAVKPGMVHYCPEGHSHSLINNGSENLIFYAVVPKQ